MSYYRLKSRLLLSLSFTIYVPASFANFKAISATTLMRPAQPSHFEENCTQTTSLVTFSCQAESLYLKAELSEVMLKLYEFKDTETIQLFEDSSRISDPHIKKMAFTFLKKNKANSDVGFFEKVKEQFFTSDLFLAKAIADIFNQSEVESYRAMASDFYTGHPQPYFYFNVKGAIPGENWMKLLRNLTDVSHFEGLFDQDLKDLTRAYWYENLPPIDPSDYSSTKGFVEKTFYTQAQVKDLQNLALSKPFLSLSRPIESIRIEMEPLSKEVERLGKLVQQGHYEYMNEYIAKSNQLSKLSMEQMAWHQSPIRFLNCKNCFLVSKPDPQNKTHLLAGLVVLEKLELNLRVLVDFYPVQAQ